MSRDRPPPRRPSPFIEALPRRKPVGIEALVSQWMRGPEAAKLRRHRGIAEALATLLSEAELARVRPVSVQRGTLTLAIADGILLSELRNHRYHALLNELVMAGTGINRLNFRLAPPRRPGR